LNTDDPRITHIEWGKLEGTRRRHAGSNSRSGEHGQIVHVGLARITTEDGCSGFGFSDIDADHAAPLLGRRLSEVFSAQSGVLPPYQALDFPVWDLIGQRQNLPVYALVANLAGASVPTSIHPLCYDTTLYFDDLHLDSTRSAAELLATQAREGYEWGHRAFKVKVGRGARHMSLEHGTERDIAVIRAVRKAIGPTAKLMLDANNGYNFNLAKQVLGETADCNIFWIEEAFHEDAELYAALRDWQTEQGLHVLIADGEGRASPKLLKWARDGFIDVVQYDILRHGFTPWLEVGRRLDEWGVRSAPHHYGRHYGNFASGHLSTAIKNFTFVEWDEATTPGLDTTGYAVEEGEVQIPDSAGFGLKLDNVVFEQAVARNGFRVSMSGEGFRSERL